MSTNNRRRNRKRQGNPQQNGNPHHNGQPNGFVTDGGKPATSVQSLPEDCIEADGGAVVKDGEHAEWVWVACNRRGFEGVEAEINVHFVAAELDDLPRRLLDGLPQRVIRHVRNWPTAKWSRPFRGEGPMSFIIWATVMAPQAATRQWVSDPNFLTE